MPAAVAVPAAISAGSSLFSGILGSSAASRAAAIQQQAAQQQAAQFQQTLNQYNPLIASAGTNAATGVTDATRAGQTGLASATQGGQTGLASATQDAQSQFNPYMQGGSQAEQTLTQMMAPGGQLTQPFTTSMMEANDPGYAFRMAQAAKALQGSAAARGGALGGGAASALAGQQQSLASNEFGAAQQRYVQGQQQQYNMLSGQAQQGMNAANLYGGYGMQGAQGIANLGMQGAQGIADLGMQGSTTAGQFMTNSAQQQAQNALGTQQQIANMMTGGAASQAAGVMGTANAFSGMFGGLSNTANQVGQYQIGQDTLKKLMQNPALASFIMNPRTGHAFNE